jgi:hypothetical protein
VERFGTFANGSDGGIYVMSQCVIKTLTLDDELLKAYKPHCSHRRPLKQT